MRKKNITCYYRHHVHCNLKKKKRKETDSYNYHKESLVIVGNKISHTGTDAAVIVTQYLVYILAVVADSPRHSESHGIIQSSHPVILGFLIVIELSLSYVGLLSQLVPDYHCQAIYSFMCLQLRRGK